MLKSDIKALKGRGSQSNPQGRYLKQRRLRSEDLDPNEALPAPGTTVTQERARDIISRNNSPDLPFEQSINPYRGCEHGCVYCYARPSHAYLDLSPGQDFETKLFAKTNAPELLEQALSKPSYRCRLIALGANTDPYQPIERDFRITRRILEILNQYRHPVSIVTKSCLIERDIDVLSAMAELNLVEVHLSVTTLENRLAARLEPRATAPIRRIETIRRLAASGIPTGVMFAPVIPVLNDAEMERVLERAAGAGASYAGYVLLRLPGEVNALFQEWLRVHVPLKSEHIMNRIRDLRGGRENDSAFGARFRGSGVYAQLMRRRFEVACKRLGLNRSKHTLNIEWFRSPLTARRQLRLF
ncbi:MAG: PA0069 family radical SAM protein [Gammaproteobacteria bacterium]